MINASPKRITCASRYFLDLMGVQLLGHKTEHIKLTGANAYGGIFQRFSGIDALVIACPVYVDGLPSGVLRFLQEAERFIKENGCRFKLYALINCGFVEGRQCRHALSAMRSFAETSGLEWSGGLGIGGGEALNFMRLTPLFAICSLILSLPVYLVRGDFWGGLASYPWMGFIINMAVFLVFSSWMLIAVARLGQKVRRLKTVRSFTASFLMPSLLFAATSNTYWIIRSALFGRGFWELYKKD
jgi:hypothetical protein